MQATPPQIPRWLSLPAAAAVLLTCGTPQASGQAFLKRLLPVKRVAADPAADYTLTEKNGPWLVMACTFSGDGAERQARELVVEFRGRFNLPAYAHAMNFELNDAEQLGRGIDERGAPIKMRYRKGEAVEEWAVLVGDFPSVDDPEAQKLLKTVKTLQPAALEPDENGITSRSLAAERQTQSKYVPRLKNNRQLGPMRTAFMARNPVLPQEYFVPKGVDKFVEKMNRGLPYSLLANKKKYTLKVATFDGQGVLQGARNAPRAEDRRGDKPSALEEAVDNAELLVIAMRDAGFEAYSFHDRNESIVTVGGFDAPVSRGIDGSAQPVPEIARLMRTFGAAFNTPSDPLQRAGLERKVQAEAAVRLASFNQRFSAQQSSGPARLAGGLEPKFARITKGAPRPRILPFDVHPTVVEVPRKSISARFAWRR